MKRTRQEARGHSFLFATKLFLLLLVLFSTTVTFGGCSSEPSAKSENEIKEDIATFDNLLITSMDDRTFTFEKRQTNTEEKNDKVWVSVDARDEIANYQSSYEIEYRLYNDDWKLENINVTDRQLFPVNGTEGYINSWSKESGWLYIIHEVDWNNLNVLLQTSNILTNELLEESYEESLYPYFYDGSDGEIIDFGFRTNEFHLSLNQDSSQFLVPYQINDGEVSNHFSIAE